MTDALVSVVALGPIASTSCTCHCLASATISSISSSVNVSVDNFYLQPGDKSLDELFETVGNGLYITGLDGLHAGVNQVSGNFSLKCSGYKIENGKKTDPVTLIILTSSFQYMMNNIREIGNDLEFRGTVGSPSVIVKKMSISGK